MTALRTRDLRAVLDVAWSLGEAPDLPAFRRAALELCAGLVPGDVHGYNEVPPGGAAPLVMMNATPAAAAWQEALVRLRDEHPLVRRFLATGDGSATAISDLMTPRAFRGSEFYRDVLSFADGRDQIAVSMGGPGGVVIGLAVNRLRPGFSRRDHEVLDALRPFLVQAHRRVVERERRDLTPVALRDLGLTQREAEVLALVARGATNAGIAGTLGCSELTVAKHLTHVYGKLGVANRTGAVREARERLAL
jgi:DNA-binding CsgD family transcriptional regulator